MLAEHQLLERAGRRVDLVHDAAVGDHERAAVEHRVRR